MGCLSSKPAVKEAAPDSAADVDDAVDVAGASPGRQHADADDAAHAVDTSASAEAAAAAPPDAGEGGTDMSALETQQREAQACDAGPAGAADDLDTALRELNGRVQRRCGCGHTRLHPLLSTTDAVRRAAELAQREVSGVRRMPEAAPSGELLLELAQLHARIQARSAR